jgi:energy-coupling factor transporter ATP-binding protein EcfA2
MVPGIMESLDRFGCLKCKQNQNIAIDVYKEGRENDTNPILQYYLQHKEQLKSIVGNIKVAQIESKKLLVVRAPQGSGKSTLAKQLGVGGVVLSSDDFFMKEGKYVFNVNLLGQAHQWNQNRAEEAMKKGISPIVIDNTNSRLFECRKYVELGLKYGYEIEFASPNWHPNLKTKEGKWNTDFLAQLQQNPDRKDINKSIPREVIERNVNRFEYQLPNETKEQFIQRILKS